MEQSNPLIVEAQPSFSFLWLFPFIPISVFPKTRMPAHAHEDYKQDGGGAWFLWIAQTNVSYQLNS